jgi:hypothetical protein
VFARPTGDAKYERLAALKGRFDPENVFRHNANIQPTLWRPAHTPGMTRPPTPPAGGELDVAIVGAGAAGTYLAYRLIQARPDWRIAIFERSSRIGGRLWSVRVDGQPHPIELGGMRYMSGHPLVPSVVDELGIETRAFDPADQPERTFLRGVIGRSPDDPEAGRGYDLPAGEAGRSAADLMRGAFLKIVPQARELDEAGWRRHRATATFSGRALTDWSIAEAVATILSPEGHRFATDAFGYDSGIRPHNAGDAIQYVMGTGYPSGKARVPVDWSRSWTVRNSSADAGASVSSRTTSAAKCRPRRASGVAGVDEDPMEPRVEAIGVA